MAKFTSRLAVLAFSLLPAVSVLRAADAAPPPADAAKLADAENKLSTALHSYELLQRDNDRLKATIASLQAELDQLRQQNSPPPASDVSSELANAKDRLATALRSYSLLEAENDRLKSGAAKLAAETQAAAAKTSADYAARLTSLSDELRQVRAQLAALATENADLKTRRAIAGPAPGSVLAPPRRP